MKPILTILLFLSFKLEAQSYVDSWTGWGHLSYQVQQGIDSNNWATIGTVTGALDSTNYQFTVPGPNYYYRVKADKDSTSAILIPEVLSIQNEPPGHIKKKITALSVKVMVSSKIHYTIESQRQQQMQYSLYDITGRKLVQKPVNLYEGVNEIYEEKPFVKGIYYGQFVGYFDFITAKINNE